MANAFTHIDDKGRVRMVDVTSKAATDRIARAQAVVSMLPDTFAMIQDQTIKKGNVLETARIAGIMAAKLLKGHSIRETPVENARKSLMAINRSRLRELGIPLPGEFSGIVDIFVK